MVGEGKICLTHISQLITKNKANHGLIKTKGSYLKKLRYDNNTYHTESNENSYIYDSPNYLVPFQFF